MVAATQQRSVSSCDSVHPAILANLMTVKVQRKYQGKYLSPLEVVEEVKALCSDSTISGVSTCESAFGR